MTMHCRFLRSCLLAGLFLGFFVTRCWGDQPLPASWRQAPHRGSPYAASLPDNDPWQGLWFYRGYQLQFGADAAPLLQPVISTFELRRVGDRYICSFPEESGAQDLIFTLKKGRLVESFAF